MATLSAAGELGTICLPVVTATDDEALQRAVNEVAETLANHGVQIVDKGGNPARGVTDERAVIGALTLCARHMAVCGHLDDATALGEVMDRIRSLPAVAPWPEV